MRITVAKVGLLAACLILMGMTQAFAQEKQGGFAEIVALDECDPATFNAARLDLSFATTLHLLRLFTPGRYPTYFQKRQLELRTPGGISSLMYSISSREQ